MNAGRAVYGILSANSGVTDIVGTRIFPEIAEQEAVTPFVIYQLQSVAPEDTHDGPSKLDEVRFEFLCYADSYNEAADLGVAVRGALDRVSGTYNGVNVESVQFNDVDVEIEYDPRRYSQVLKFTFRIKRDDIEIALGTPVTGAELGDLSDVDVSGVTNGQLIAYNSSTGNWEAADDAGGASTLDELDDVEVDNPSVGQSIMWDSGSGGRWVKDSRTTILYEEFKQGLETTVKNGAGTDSELKLEQTKATVQTGKTKVVLTETSPGDIEFVVATDADGDTAFTALHLDGSSKANEADLLVKFGTYFKFEAGNFTQWVRPSSGATQDTTIILPSTSGVLGLAEDIPTSVTNLDDVTSAGSGAIITDAERTNLTTNTAKVGLIAGGTTGQALVKSTGTDYDVEWADIAVDVQYHDRYASEAETLLDGATETVELYYTAQADGDGLHEEAQSDTPSAGNVIRRKLWYAEKAQADPDTSGDWTQFADIADDTTYANAKAALLAYLKERTGGTVPISLKMTWEEVAEATLLLDTYTGAAAAYSLRKLRTAYTGDAINVWNGTSYADIGFDGSGELDTTALAAHCGSNDGFIRYWYDQSGNSNDAAQTTTANMPKIYDGTTGVVTENGKPSLELNADSLTISSVNLNTLFAVASRGTQETLNYLTWDNNTTGLFYGGSFGGVSGIGFYDGSLYSLTGQDSNTHLAYFRLNGLNYDVAKDGNSVTTFQSGNGVMSASSIGRALSTLQTHLIQEFIVYTSDQSSNRTNIEDNINTFYNIY